MSLTREIVIDECALQNNSVVWLFISCCLTLCGVVLRVPLKIPMILIDEAKEWGSKWSLPVAFTLYLIFTEVMVESLFPVAAHCVSEA